MLTRIADPSCPLVSIIACCTARSIVAHRSTYRFSAVASCDAPV